MGVKPDNSSVSASRTPDARPVSLDAQELWTAIHAHLSEILRREQVRTWFDRVAALEFDGQTLSLAVPTEFHRTWILENYQRALDVSSSFVRGSVVSIRLLIDPEKASLGAAPPVRVETETTDAAASPAPTPTVSSSTPTSDAGRRGIASQAPARSSAPLARGMAVPCSFNPTYTFENFVVGPCNRFAFAGAMGVAENPARAYNPLFLHGSVGLGKTHLLQAIGQELLLRRPETQILYLSCETFTNHFIAALEKGSLEEFRRRYREVDVLVVDDIHFLANKERTQEEFFHTFNTLFQDQKQLVLSSDSPAKEIPSLQERLVSRFKWGLEAEIEKPCLETRLAILQRKARTMGLALPDEVAHFLAERITNNIRELEGAINRVVGFSALQKTPVSLELVRRAMPELEAERTMIVRFEDVAGVVARRHHVKIQDLQSRRRNQSIAFPRQIAMFLTRRHTKHSLEEIGAYYGGRDHSTVLYGIEKIESLIAKDSIARDTVNALSDEITRLTQRPQ